MTLIIGVRCTDGVVMGADGAATLGVPFGQHTIRQPIHKLAVIKASVLLGVSGTVAMSQLIHEGIEELWEARKFAGARPHKAKEEIINQVRPHFMRMYESARAAIPVLGPQGAASEAVNSAILAIPLQAAPCLFQITPQCAIEEASADLPFVAIGSGQPTADPFLAFIRRIFWPPGKNPSLPEGIFAALWTLKHVIETAPGLVAGPYQLALLQKGTKGCTARLLAENDKELLEQEEAIANAEGSLRDFRTSIEQPPKEEEEEPPPKMPDSSTRDAPAAQRSG